jgi:fatty acid desaturase
MMKGIRGNDPGGAGIGAAGVRGLSQVSTLTSLRTIFLDWAIIFCAVSLVHFYGAGWGIPALLVIGNRQRALVVLIHEASHRLLASSYRLNDFLAEMTLTAPMLTSIPRYRGLHNRHHAHLGNPELDTDYLHDPAALQAGPLRFYLMHLLSFSSFLGGGLLGALPQLSGSARLRIASWWGCVCCFLWLSFGASFLKTFLVLWVLARIFVYYPIITFVIISDHVGLSPGTVLGFTRNQPRQGLLRFLFHPHANGYHLTHHLLPTVPFFNLQKAHRFLLHRPCYRQAEHCESYFHGAGSVIGSWQKCIHS